MLNQCSLFYTPNVKFLLIQVVLNILITSGNASLADNTVQDKANHCELSKELKAEIANYSYVVNKIHDFVLNGIYKDQTWKTLAEFVDKFGSRISGSRNLENAIDYMLNKSIINRLENVHSESVSVPRWIRGKETATLIEPRIFNVPLLGLGGSVATPPGGITADVIVVESFEELKKHAALAKGKIVVFNQPWISYGKSVIYRTRGASEAAKVGAVASLIRSITPFSISSPHTGSQSYDDGVNKIPTACITVEVAKMFHRMFKKGIQLKLQLIMEDETLPNSISRNTVAEISGHIQPKKVVLVSGHLDSWDVGQGAMDDGGGAFISWHSLVLLKQLGLRPKRTIRCVLWTAEEQGLIGASAYAKAHADELKDMNFAMESDEGTFTPKGLEFSGTHQAGCIIKEILRLFTTYGTGKFEASDDVGSDIQVFANDGVPRGSLLNAKRLYFWYHHTNADMMNVESSTALDEGTAFWASIAYVVADLSVDLPRQ